MFPPLRVTDLFLRECHFQWPCKCLFWDTDSMFVVYRLTSWKLYNKTNHNNQLVSICSSLLMHDIERRLVQLPSAYFTCLNTILHILRCLIFNYMMSNVYRRTPLCSTYTCRISPSQNLWLPLAFICIGYKSGLLLSHCLGFYSFPLKHVTFGIEVSKIERSIDRFLARYLLPISRVIKTVLRWTSTWERLIVLVQ